MAICLSFSNNLETLAGKLADQLCLSPDPDPFLAPMLMVPNPNLGKWVRLRLAGLHQVVMNLEFQFLEAGIWDLLTALYPFEDTAAELTREVREIMLLKTLQLLPRNASQHSPVTAYLAGSDQHPAEQAARLWQLSVRLARLFEEYEFHRDDMIQNWLTGSGETDAMALCQQELYRGCLGLRDGLQTRSGLDYRSLSGYFGHVLDARAKARVNAGPPGVHIFGFSTISGLHTQILSFLAQDCDLFVYALNPSREFWEDVRTPREKKWIRLKKAATLKKGPEALLDDELTENDPNPLLAFWGKPGRESIRLFCELADYDFEACYAEPRQVDSLLDQIQYHLLTLDPVNLAKTPTPQDRSLQIFAAPGRFREVETVYNSILYNLENDPDLRLTDIAVLVPDMSTYKPVLDAVFNAGAAALPHALVDSMAEIESVYASAVSSFLALVGGRFSRREVFELMMNPCFMAKWRLTDEILKTWADWAADLRIFHTFDQQDRRQRGYPDTPAFTWKQGLQRLRLGRIMSGSGPDAEDDIQFRDLAPYTDIQAGDPQVLETFSLVIQAIHTAVGSLDTGPLSGAEWKYRIIYALDDLLVIPREMRGEKAVRQHLFTALDLLELYDRLPAGPVDPAQKNPAHLSADLVKAFVQTHLKAISGGHGDYLTSGVTISALKPMRPIPFKIVYIMGLEEGVFPGRADESGLDLRLRKRRIGDISLPEQNRYLFLEILLSTRQKLYLSYICRDLAKDRDLQPCSVLSQLKAYIESDVLPGGETFQVPRIPLKGSDRQYLEPEALSDKSDVLINYNPADRLVCLRENGWPPGDLSLTEIRSIPGMARLIPEPDLPPGLQPPEQQGAVDLQIGHLKQFLVNPVAFGLKYHLRIMDTEEPLEETITTEDEPVASEFPANLDLVNQPVAHWLGQSLAAGKPLPDAIALSHLDQIYRRHERRFMTPEAIFGDVEREAMRTTVQERVAAISELLLAAPPQAAWGAWILGRPFDLDQSASAGLPAMRLDALHLDLTADSPMKCVALHGQLPWIWQATNPENGTSERHALVITGAAQPAGNPDHRILAPLLFELACRCHSELAGTVQPGRFNIHIAFLHRLVSFDVDIPAGQSREYLRKLVSDCLSPDRLQYLPFGALKAKTLIAAADASGSDFELLEAEFTAKLLDMLLEDPNEAVCLARPDLPEAPLKKACERFGVLLSPDHVRPGRLKTPLGG